MSVVMLHMAWAVESVVLVPVVAALTCAAAMYTDIGSALNLKKLKPRKA